MCAINQRLVMVVVQQEGKRGREEIVARTTQIAEATTTWRPIEVRWQKVRTGKTERERESVRVRLRV